MFHALFEISHLTLWNVGDTACIVAWFCDEVELSQTLLENLLSLFGCPSSYSVETLGIWESLDCLRVSSRLPIFFTAIFSWVSEVSPYLLGVVDGLWFRSDMLFFFRILSIHFIFVLFCHNF